MFVDEKLVAIATRRSQSFFANDIARNRQGLTERLAGSSVLVLGGAGTIGSALIEAALAYGPRRIDVVDTNENALAALARRFRGRRDGAMATELAFNPLDIGDWAMRRYLEEAGPFDAVYNFAAIKHVRSEKNLPCILHMLNTNVVKQYDFFSALAATHEACRYFVVSTDKAADPSNFMGASKRLLEYLSFGATDEAPGVRVTSARFANVAFSNGSLLESFAERVAARVPLAAPRDTRRYFISPNEAAEICLLGELRCPCGSIAVPRLDPGEHLVDLCELAGRFLASCGFDPVVVDNPEEAFSMLDAPLKGRQYPVVATQRDTDGEKEFEVFLGNGEEVVDIGLERIEGVIAPRPPAGEVRAIVKEFRDMVEGRYACLTVQEVKERMGAILPTFHHMEGKAKLDNRL